MFAPLQGHKQKARLVGRVCYVEQATCKAAKAMQVAINPSSLTAGDAKIEAKPSKHTPVIAHRNKFFFIHTPVLSKIDKRHRPRHIGFHH